RNGLLSALDLLARSSRPQRTVLAFVHGLFDLVRRLLSVLTTTRLALRQRAPPRSLGAASLGPACNPWHPRCTSVLRVECAAGASGLGLPRPPMPAASWPRALDRFRIGIAERRSV